MYTSLEYGFSINAVPLFAFRQESLAAAALLQPAPGRSETARAIEREGIDSFYILCIRINTM